MENIGCSSDPTRLDTEFMSQESPLGPGSTGRNDEDSEGTNELMDNLNVHNDNASDSPIREGYTSQSDEASIKLLNKLMDKCTTLETQCKLCRVKFLIFKLYQLHKQWRLQSCSSR